MKELEREKGRRGEGKVEEGMGEAGQGWKRGEKENLTLYSFVSLRALWLTAAAAAEIKRSSRWRYRWKTIVNQVKILDSDNWRKQTHQRSVGYSWSNTVNVSPVVVIIRPDSIRQLTFYSIPSSSSSPSSSSVYLRTQAYKTEKYIYNMNSKNSVLLGSERPEWLLQTLPL